MFHNSHTTGRFFRRGLGLALVLVTLSVNGALAAGGGKPEPTTGTPVTVVFDDLVGDAIGSDGLGAYDATIEDGVITLATGKKRKLSFDFSTCVGGSCEGPFGSSTSGEVSDVAVTLDVSNGTAVFKFTAGRKYLLTVGGLLITTIDDNGDGTIEGYFIETSGEAGHTLWRQIQRVGRGVEPGSTRYESIGFFSMPWGIEVTVD
jgi:hypothetical protein